MSETIKTAIISMLTENTGRDFLDSGGDDGRQWQQNQLIRNWDAIPACKVETYGIDATITYDIYNYLTNFLSITEQSKLLNEDLKDIMGCSVDSYFDDIEDSISREDITVIKPLKNSYNYENILDGALIYSIFEYNGNDYIVLQVHGGADVRGGYTEPRVFALDDPEYFMMAQYEIFASCECDNYYSDDCGYNWRNDACNGPVDVTAWIYDSDTNTVKCPKCGGLIKFSVMEQY